MQWLKVTVAHAFKIIWGIKHDWVGKGQKRNFIQSLFNRNFKKHGLAIKGNNLIQQA